MENSFLLPRKFSAAGWIIFILFSQLAFTAPYLNFDPEFLKFTYGNCTGTTLFDCQEISLINTISIGGSIIGLLFISFARTRQEDEYISFLRLKCWQWSVLISYLILLIANFTLFSSGFLVFMIYNMFTVLIVFTLKFNFSLYRLRKEQHEK